MMILIILAGIIGLILIDKRIKFFLHMVQLEGYSSKQFQNWILNNKEKVFKLRVSKNETKKPLVFTSRAKRLYILSTFFNITLILIFTLKSIRLIDISIGFRILTLLIYLILVGLLYFLQAFIVLFANNVLSSIEAGINMGFYNEAQQKIKSMKNLMVVGITGSFGKTSTKFIVGSILEDKYNVLNTPESYNTPMGLSKVINNDLTEEHDIFIAELGARNIGDIKEVSELVQPKIGVITSIGATHIETFKNIDNIMKTKYELIEELPTDGIAIFNYDNEYIRKLADKTFKEKILYGLEDFENLDIFAENIEVSELGSTFTLKDKDGNSINCRTKLLGKHNIYNILAGVSVAKILGLTFEEIRYKIEKLEPIPHRLNIINPGTGIIIIDDAFNSNPIGAKAALDVLSQFKDGNKIIVTPGMIELGAMEKEANKEFGVNIGKVCDYVILVGENRTKPIYDGLMEVNYNIDNIFIVNSLDEATQCIQKIAKPKDVILFENDLPDNYSE